MTEPEDRCDKWPYCFCCGLSKAELELVKRVIDRGTDEEGPPGPQ